MKVKEQKILESSGLTMRLYELNDRTLAGVDVWDGTMTVNEQWTKRACEEMVRTGEMKFYEEDNCVTEQEVQKLYDDGNEDLAIS